MAHYKSAPSYEFIRGAIYVQFSPWGDFLTNDPVQIKALDAICAQSPFIKRVDVEQPKVTEVSDSGAQGNEEAKKAEVLAEDVTPLKQSAYKAQSRAKK
jgi:hypothetical protein